MVVGGYPAENEAEIVDLSETNVNCPTIPNFPGASYGSVGTFINGRALVCGGESSSDSCYSYNQEVLNIEDFKISNISIILLFLFLDKKLGE